MLHLLAAAYVDLVGVSGSDVILQSSLFFL